MMIERKRLYRELQSIEQDIFPDNDNLDINTATPEQIKRIKQIRDRAEYVIDQMDKRGTGPYDNSLAWEEWMYVLSDARCDIEHIEGTN